MSKSPFLTDHHGISTGLTTFAPLNSVKYKIIFTYIPVAVGLTTEPLLIAIATCRYMFAPYAALDAGPTSSPKSLALDFDKSPPHFQLFRALRTCNFSLAGLTAMILLSNVLAVALVGLFSARTGKFHDRIPVSTYAFPTLLKNFSTPASDMYFLLDESLSNDSTRSKALTWTTDLYYVVRLLPTAAPPGLEEYNVTTLGIGVDIQCTPVAADKITLTCDLPSTGILVRQ